jgi:hypothetical protein
MGLTLILYQICVQIFLLTDKTFTPFEDKTLGLKLRFPIPATIL